MSTSIIRIFEFALISSCIYYVLLAIGSATVFCFGIRKKQFEPTLIITALFVIVAARWVLFSFSVEGFWQLKGITLIFFTLLVLQLFLRKFSKKKHGVGIIRYIKKHLTDPDCCIACLFILLVSLNYLGRIPANALPIFTLGNNDLFYFLNVSNYLFDPTNVANTNSINYIHELKHDVFGVMAAIAWISSLFEHNTSAIFPLISVILATSALSIFTISNHLLQNKYSSIAISAIFLLSPTVYYIAGHHFIGQLIAWSTLLALLNEEIHTNCATNSSTTHAYFASYGLLIFSYPSYILPLVLVHYLTIIIVRRRNSNNQIQSILEWTGRTFQQIMPLTFRLFCVFSVLALIFFERVKHAFLLMKSQSVASNGWTLPLVKMQALLLQPFDIAQLQSSWNATDYFFAAMFLLTASAHCIIFSCKRKGQDTLLDNYFSSHKMLLLLTTIFVMYFIVYITLGPSYNQWKFASFIVTPLAFIFYIILFQDINYFFKHTKWAAAVPALLTACVILPLDWHYISKTSFNSHLSFAQPKYFDMSFSELARLTQEIHGNNIGIDLEPFAETMLAMNFLYRSSVFPRQQTYFNRHPTWPPPIGNGLKIVLNNQCRRITTSDLTIGRFSVTDDINYDLYYPFINLNTNYNLSSTKEICFDTHGFAYFESGIVSHGQHSSLLFFADPSTNGYVLKLTGSGFSNSLLPPISIHVCINGTQIGSWSLNDIDTNEEIEFMLPSCTVSDHPVRIALTFNVVNPRSMSDFGFPDDGNRYGFILKRIALHPI